MLNPIKTSTFSIVGFDPETKELGVALQSKFLAAGAVVPFAKAGVGAVATQALANPSYGPNGLKLLEEGLSPEDVIKELTNHDEGASNRQIGIIDFNGRSATYTGSDCMDWAGGITGDNFAAQGNILVNRETVLSMGEAFKEKSGSLADKLVRALLAGEKAGGDKRGKQSASLLIYKEKGGYGGLTDKYIDLRVDDDPDPIGKLEEMLELFYLYFSDRDVKNIPLKGSALKEVQSLLIKFGLFQGKADGKSNPEFQKALTTFYHQENFEERKPKENVIPEDILDYLRKRIEK